MCAQNRLHMQETLDMISLKLTPYQSPFYPDSFKCRTNVSSLNLTVSTRHGKLTTRASNERKTFLTLEEAGLVEISGLSTHEKFLCRLTISSLNLLRIIAVEEACQIEELNAGRLCDWFTKDKLKREHNIDSAVLQWDDSDFPV